MHCYFVYYTTTYQCDLVPKKRKSAALVTGELSAFYLFLFFSVFYLIKSLYIFLLP